MGNGKLKVAELTGTSDYIKNIAKAVKSVSGNRASVLLVGEKGTGKKLIAQQIHYLSDENSNKRDFFEVNCKLPQNAEIQMVLNGITRFIPENKKVTLFVNYVENLNLQLQEYFLKTINIVREKNLQVRFICSTDTNLEFLVEKGSFLKELLQKINTVVLNTIPLRQRKEDIIQIAEVYRNQFCIQSGINLTGFTADALELIENNFWKGNIDELINSIQRAFIVGEGPIIKASDLGLGQINEIEMSADIKEGGTLQLKEAVDQFKKEYITKVLEQNGWNQTKSAQILGIQRTYVIKLINELNIRKQ